MAERVALNAKDAGLSLRPATTGEIDLRLVRVPIASGNPSVALSELLTRIGMPAVKNKSGAMEDLYDQEQSAIATERVIPLFHLPIAYASAPALKDCDVRLVGTWDLERTWLETLQQ
jgi:hypothetical protein